jgi:hypothetical protein
LGEASAGLLAEVEQRRAGVSKQLGIVVRPVEQVLHEQAILTRMHPTLPKLMAQVGASVSSTSLLERYVTAQMQALKIELGERQGCAQEASELEVVEYMLRALPGWSSQPVAAIKAAEAVSMERLLRKWDAALRLPAAPPAPHPPPPSAKAAAYPKPLPVTPRPPSVAARPPAPPARPPAPPRPKQPPINWGTVWEKSVDLVASGVLLRALLYLGAFMIVVSATVLVIRFWDVFPALLQLLFIAAVPTIFYLAGWLVGAFLELPQAGGVLTGIGALLVAVALAGIYQFGGLSQRVDGSLYWFVAAILCTGIYTLTAWRLSGEFFDVITLLAATGAALATTRLLHLALEWSIASIAASCAAMTVLASLMKRITPAWTDSLRAARYLPQILIPVSLVFTLFVAGETHLGRMSAFLLAAVGYTVLARTFPAVIFAHAAAWSMVGSVLYAFLAIQLPTTWYAAGAALLAIPYLVGGHRLPRPGIPPRGYPTALTVVGLCLLVIAAGSGLITLLIDYWPGVTALALSALALAASAFLLRSHWLAGAAAALFFLPFSLAVGRWLGNAWLMAAWAGLALVYLGIGALLRRAEAYARWLHLGAHAIALLAPPALLFHYLLTYRHWRNGPALVALGGLALVYLLSALLDDSRRHPALSRYARWFGQSTFLWPLAAYPPIWVAVAWKGTPLTFAWLGVALAWLGLAYVGLGELLTRRRAEYRLPLHVYVYLLLVASLGVAAALRLSLLAAICLSLVTLAMLALAYRRVAETPWLRSCPCGPSIWHYWY